MADEGALGMWSELFFSLIVDAAGMLSYFFLPVGEAFDIIIAPITVGYILSMMDDREDLKRSRKAFAFLGGFEELAPAIDIIPSATIAWTYKWIITKPSS